MARRTRERLALHRSDAIAPVTIVGVRPQVLGREWLVGGGKGLCDGDTVNGRLLQRPDDLGARRDQPNARLRSRVVGRVELDTRDPVRKLGAVLREYRLGRRGADIFPAPESVALVYDVIQAPANKVKATRSLDVRGGAVGAAENRARRRDVEEEVVRRVGPLNRVLTDRGTKRTTCGVCGPRLHNLVVVDAQYDVAPALHCPRAEPTDAAARVDAPKHANTDVAVVACLSRISHGVPHTQSLFVGARIIMSYQPTVRELTTASNICRPLSQLSLS